MTPQFLRMSLADHRGIYEPASDFCNFVNRHLAVACAGEQPNAASLIGDAQNVVKIIGGDKLKIRIYCEIRELTDEAEQEENLAKADELSEKIDILEEKLGPEFVTLVHTLTDIDANSQDAHEIRSALDALEVLCGD